MRGRLTGLIWLIALGATALLVPVEAFAQERIALVIGNSAYRHVPVLPNPRNDAQAMADLFRRAGFDRVDEHYDLGIAALRRAVRDFAAASDGAELAVVFFAGHGIEVDGDNHLIPVDARLETDFDVEDETISLDRLLRAIEPARRLRLVILDACRDNPFVPRMRRTAATRSIGRGLARVEPTVSDTLVAFAARAGQVAADGSGSHSPFTAALLKHLATPDLDLRIAFGRVRDEVLEATGRRQQPFTYGSLGGDIVSIALVTPPAIAPPETTRPRAPLDPKQCREEAWAKSIEWDRPTSMLFRNGRMSPVDVFWIDYAGKRKFYSTLQPGEQYVQPTYMTHPWVVTDQSGKCLRFSMPTQTMQTVDVR